MRLRLRAPVIAAIVALAILVAGGGYAASHHRSYQSDAQLALSPNTTQAAVVSNDLSGFATSGSAGTFVALISSPDTLKAAGVANAGVSVTARADPTARIIGVTATGPQRTVQPALIAIVRSAIVRQSLVNDAFHLSEVSTPSAPIASGPSRTLLLLATVLIAALGALAVFIVMRRFAVPGGGAAFGMAGGAGYELLDPGRTVTFHLEAFRRIRASATTVLLQVAGYWRSDLPQSLPAPLLVLHDGNGEHVLAALAAPNEHPAEAGPSAPLWTRSFAVPIEIIGPNQRLSLRVGSIAVGLPQPSERLALGFSDTPLAEPSSLPVAEAWAASEGNGHADERRVRAAADDYAEADEHLVAAADDEEADQERAHAAAEGDEAAERDADDERASSPNPGPAS